MVRLTPLEGTISPQSFVCVSVLAGYSQGKGGPSVFCSENAKSLSDMMSEGVAI